MSPEQRYLRVVCNYYFYLQIETGKIHVRFLGHKTFVYSLNWSSDDYHLLSASADQTARIWDIRNQIVQHIEVIEQITPICYVKINGSLKHAFFRCQYFPNIFKQIHLCAYILSISIACFLNIFVL